VTRAIVQLILTAILGAGIAVLTVGSQAAALPGDPTAKAEVIAAFTRLNALPGYRIKFAGRDSAGVRTGIGEVAPPDKLHWMLRSPQGTIAFVSVGQESRIQYAMSGAPAGWQCLANASRPIVLFDIDKMSKERLRWPAGPTP